MKLILMFYEFYIVIWSKATVSNSKCILIPCSMFINHDFMYFCAYKWWLYSNYRLLWYVISDVTWFIITHLHVRCAHSYIAISTYIHPSCPQRVILSGSVAPSMLLSLHLNSPQIQVMMDHECLSPRKGLWNGISPHGNHFESLLQVHHYLLNVIALCLANSYQNHHLT